MKKLASLLTINGLVPIYGCKKWAKKGKTLQPKEEKQQHTLA